MHDNNDPFIKQKIVSKNHNKFDEIIHPPVPLKNEGKWFKDMHN
jgi:hypothetical protein